MVEDENVKAGDVTVAVGTGAIGSEGVMVFVGIKRERVGGLGGYMSPTEARALAALLLKHADRAEGR